MRTVVHQHAGLFTRSVNSSQVRCRRRRPCVQSRWRQSSGEPVLDVMVCRFAARLFSAVRLGSPVSCRGHVFVDVRKSGVDGSGTGPPVELPAEISVVVDQLAFPLPSLCACPPTTTARLG